MDRRHKWYQVYQGEDFNLYRCKVCMKSIQTPTVEGFNKLLVTSFRLMRPRLEENLLTPSPLYALLKRQEVH